MVHLRERSERQAYDIDSDPHMVLIQSENSHSILFDKKSCYYLIQLLFCDA